MFTHTNSRRAVNDRPGNEHHGVASELLLALLMILGAAAVGYLGLQLMWLLIDVARPWL